MVRKTKPAAQTPAPTATKTAKKFGDDDVISAIAPNYKRPGSDAFRRYALYREGMTVRQALDGGLKWVDLLWDANPKNGYITITPAS